MIRIDYATGSTMQVYLHDYEILKVIWMPKTFDSQYQNSFLTQRCLNATAFRRPVQSVGELAMAN
jgi:hypothetical protein